MAAYMAVFIVAIIRVYYFLYWKQINKCNETITYMVPCQNSVTS